MTAKNARRRRGFSHTESNDSTRALRRKLNSVLTYDREPLRRRLEKLEREFHELATASAASLDSKQNDAKGEKSRPDGHAKGDPVVLALDPRFAEWERRLDALAKDCDASSEKAQARLKSFPKITYDDSLPIVERREEIKKLISENQVVIVCGETGSGKSTQLPKLLMELGIGARGLVGCTQPRRIAARSIAQRVADELKTPLGEKVGYKIRFTDQTSESSIVKLMTDGILLAESQTDRFFNRYEAIIVDEAHERSLNVDFLLGMLKRVLRVRRDLKLIITSATIDAQRFAEHFYSAKGPAPIVEIAGRTYPIEILYRPVDEWKRRREESNGEEDATRKPSSRSRDPEDDDAFEGALLDAIDELARRGPGDMLVFMPTERDIAETAKLLKNHPIPGDDAARKTTILPLYARLPAEEQQKIFGKVGFRKIVVATNVAESSLTVPGIRYVIDVGTARVSRYSPRAMTQRLPIEPISQASANQRAGRCGRVGPGVCIRLYSENDFNGRDEYPTPEIRRSNLASVILQTKALRLGEVEKFPFIDPPARSSIEDGYRTLYEIGATTETRELTELGKTLSRLPLDPRIGRIVLAAAQENALRDVLPIAAALEIQDPRERPREKAAAADEKHAPFLDPDSDFLSFLKLWDFWQNLKEKTTKNQLRKACRENFLSYNRMREWSDVYLQLVQIARDLKLQIGERRNDYDSIHRSLLTGLLYGIARKSDVGVEYATTTAGKFVLWPGSGLKKKPLWIVASERIATERQYLRTVAKINPDWIEEIGASLIKRTCADPFWNRETGYVHAYERTSLYGLTITPKRRINYGPIDPERARSIFIYEALVAREFDSNAPFFTHNGKVEEDAKKMRDKLRNYELVKSLDAVYEFYDARIPKDVYDAVTLKTWLKRATSAEKTALFASLADFCRVEDIDEDAVEAFPDALELDGESALPIEYKFNPGGEDDGATIVAPLEALRQLDSRRLGWLVPGLVEQKIVALLKSLPKEIRRELFPIQETARCLAAKLNYGVGSLEDQLAREVGKIAQRGVTKDDFDYDRVPTELKFNVKVVDDVGEFVAQGRDADELRKSLGVKLNLSLETVSDEKWTRDGLKSWDFGDLPKSVSIRRGAITAAAYPALCDPRTLDSAKTQPTSTLSLRLFDTQDKALRFHELGVRRLFQMENARDMRNIARWTPGYDRLGVFARSIKGFDLESAICDLVAALALGIDVTTAPTKEAEYRAIAMNATRKFGVAAQDATLWIDRFLSAYHEATLAIEQRRKGPTAEVAKDAERQIQRILAPNFMLTTPTRWLMEFPRYFKAIPMRFEKWLNGGARSDAQFVAELEAYWNRYRQKAEAFEREGVVDLELETFRWAIEEYRVSLFAQKLGTSIKISPVRLEKIWEKIPN